MLNESIPKWKLLKSRIVFNNQWYKLRQDTIEIKPGKVIDDYFIGVFPNIVLVVALTVDGKVLLVEQYKHGAGEILLEVPAGYIDKGESPLVAAKRELLEETGYKAEKWEMLGFFYGNPTKERGNGIYIFLASGAKQVSPPKFDETERINLFLVRLDEVVKKIIKNEIKVAGSVVALLLSLRKIKREKSTPS